MTKIKKSKISKDEKVWRLTINIRVAVLAMQTHSREFPRRCTHLANRITIGLTLQRRHYDNLWATPYHEI